MNQHLIHETVKTRGEQIKTRGDLDRTDESALDACPHTQVILKMKENKCLFLLLM